MLLLSKVKFYILVIFLIAITPLSLHAREMTSKAEYAYVLDYNTGTVLFEKNAYEPMAPSSMTKLMTTYLTFDAIKRGEITMDTEFRVSEKAWRKGGSKMFVKEGDAIKVSDLLRGIIVQSGNDACIVVAEGISGSEEAFAEDMNFIGNKIGLTDSHFKNSTGWPDPEHLTTAHDLAIITKRLIDDFPEYYSMFSEEEFTFSKIKQANRNKLLYRNIGADGLKTGYTEKAGYGIVASAVKNDRRIIVVVNGLKTEKERIQESERLLNFGFRKFKNVSLYKKGDVVEKAKIWSGEDKYVPLIVDEDIEYTINKRISQKGNIELSVTYKAPWPAPVKKGTHIANLIIKNNGKTEREVPLFAANDVEKLSFFGKIKALPMQLLLGK